MKLTAYLKKNEDNVPEYGDVADCPQSPDSIDGIGVKNIKEELNKCHY